MVTSKGKRPLDSTGADDQSPPFKLPTIRSLISEIRGVGSDRPETGCFCHKLDKLPKILREFADWIEEFTAQPRENFSYPARLGSAVVCERLNHEVTEAAYPNYLELRILNTLHLPIFTNDEVTGKDGEEISVALIDANGEVFRSFPEVILNVVVLEGNFNCSNDEKWSKEDFDIHIVKKRENNALLVGHLLVTLKRGVAELGDLKFTDNSSFVWSKKFRLGLQVAPSSCKGIRIREAITEPFKVKDCRVKINGKHDAPQVNDEIWRLKSIGKGGVHHKKLNDKGLETVEDFLRLLVINEQELQQLLLVGMGGMKNKQWKDLKNHAKTCIPSRKLYFVPTAYADIGTIILNNFYELSEFIVGGRRLSAVSLTGHQKDQARASVKEAYQKKTIMEYDDNHASLSQHCCNNSITPIMDNVWGVQDIHSPTPVTNNGNVPFPLTECPPCPCLPDHGDSSTTREEPGEPLYPHNPNYASFHHGKCSTFQSHNSSFSANNNIQLSPVSPSPADLDLFWRIVETPSCQEDNYPPVITGARQHINHNGRFKFKAAFTHLLSVEIFLKEVRAV